MIKTMEALAAKGYRVELICNPDGICRDPIARWTCSVEENPGKVNEQYIAIVDAPTPEAAVEMAAFGL